MGCHRQAEGRIREMEDRLRKQIHTFGRHHRKTVSKAKDKNKQKEKTDHL